MDPVFHDQSTSSTLLSRTRQGNRFAQETIYEIYCPLVYDWGRTVGLGHEDALDNTQQIFIKLFSSIASYDRGQGRFRRWLWRMTRNAAIDLFRKKQRDDALHRDASREAETVQPPDSATSSRIPQAVAKKALEVLMHRYDGRTMEVAIEILIHARPAAAVAKEYGISIGSVYTNRSRALKLLRESLDELEFFPKTDREQPDSEPEIS